MDENSLNLAFAELKANLADWMGFGSGPPVDREWTDRQERQLKMFLKEGQADFYFSPISWSFNRPLLTVTLASGEDTVDLPADIGGVEGRVYYTSSEGSGAGWLVVPFGSIGRIVRAETALVSQTGPPQRAAIEAVKGMTKVRGGLMRIRIFPTADQDYTLRFQGYVIPQAMSGDRPFGYGGTQHAHTILQACKAAAERNRQIVNGPEQMKFMERLKASMLIDARFKPDNWGYNTDRSYERDVGWRRNPFDGVTVTLAGLDPTEGIA